MDCSPPGSSVHGILQTRIPERVAISFSRGYSQPRDWIHVSCIAGELFPTKPPGKTLYTIEWDKESPQVLSRCSVYVRHVSDLLLCSPTCNSTFVSCVCFIKCRYLYLRGISKTILFGIYLIIRSDQISHSVMSDSATPWITARQASLSITNSRSSLRLTSIESVMPSNHLILCCPLLLLTPILIRVFSNESTLRMRWPKYWSFSFSIIPCKEIPGLISFRMDWIDAENGVNCKLIMIWKVVN